MIYIKIIGFVIVVILIVIALVFINLNYEYYTTVLNAYDKDIPEKNGSEKVFSDDDDNNYEYRIDQERVNRITQVYNRAGVEEAGIDYESLY